MSVTERSKKEDIEKDEIEFRLSDILQFLKDSRRTVIYSVLTFFILGVLYALTQENEYTATVKVMPELKTSAGGGGGLGDLKSLASLAGVNLGGLSGTSEAIRPDLYPDIIQSVPFSLYLLKQTTTTKESQKPQTLEKYLTQKTENSFTAKISKLFGGSSSDLSNPVLPAALQLTRQQEALSKMINARVSATMDKKSGIITITSQMTDPVVTATIARQTLDYLTNYVTSYRTGKARQQVKFLTEQVNIARHRYESMEFQLSSYRDRNRNTYLNTAKIEEQRIQADYLLAQNVYSDLSKQLEQARIKVQEEAPVFQVLEPPFVPLKKSGPKRTIIVVGFSLMGAIIGLFVFFIKKFARQRFK